MSDKKQEEIKQEKEEKSYIGNMMNKIKSKVDNAELLEETPEEETPQSAKKRKRRIKARQELIGFLTVIFLCIAIAYFGINLVLLVIGLVFYTIAAITGQAVG